jgi:hypothetical protein
VKSSKTITGFLEFSVLAFIVFILMMILLWGCKHEPILPELNPEETSNGGNTGGTGGGTGNGSGNTGIPCDPDSVYFQNDILPLFVSNCAKSGCHDATSHQDGIVLNSYSAIMSSGEIEAGDPSEGDIMEVITENDPDKIMPQPPNAPLTSAQVNMIATWISQGAQNNFCSGDCDTLNVIYSGKIAPLLQAKCVGCHNNNTTSGNINLSNHAGVQQQALNGRLWGAVNHEAGYSPMPKGGAQLPSCEIAMIRIWIEDGAANN